MAALIISVASVQAQKSQVAIGKQQVLPKTASHLCKRRILYIAMVPNLMYGLPKTISWLSTTILSTR